MGDGAPGGPVRAVVTGGAGFIGSHLVDRLVGDGHAVVVIDSLVRGSTANLSGALDSGRCELIEYDITDPRVRELMASSSPDVVYHLAAQIDVRSSVADPVHDARVNVVGAVAVLDAACRAGVGQFVLASSVAIYGVTPTLPVTESAPTEPLSPYAASKLAGEIYLNQAARLHGMPGTVLCFGNVYGPRQDANGEAGVVAIFADALLRGRSTRVFGDGGNVRDYVYVTDVVDAFVMAGSRPGDGNRFNIGTGVGTSDLALHTAVAEAVGAQQVPEFVPARPGDLRAMTLDATAAVQRLGWSPRTGLDDGLARTVAWARRRVALEGRV
ncbi:MAG: NAD-dependent epimerase/dehydratase family protein [Pseudonocardiaceae bacterium]|nr:NAD-dependent epimerase/dehydratase family protein [Pseudonocardiaceae bacterium]